MTRAVASIVMTALVAATGAAAEELVYFRNGQAMRVEKTRQDGRWLYLTLASEQEMGILLRQVKKVEPAEPLPNGVRETPVVANVVSGAGAGGGYSAPVATETYDAAAEMGEEQAVQQAIPPEMAVPPGGQPQIPQGQDLVPRPRRSRTNRR